MEEYWAEVGKILDENWKNIGLKLEELGGSWKNIGWKLEEFWVENWKNIGLKLEEYWVGAGIILAEAILFAEVGRP